VQHSLGLGPNVEAQLDALLLLDMLDKSARVWADDQIQDVPVEVRVRQLNVEARLAFLPPLVVVNVVELPQQVEFFEAGVDGVH